MRDPAPWQKRYSRMWMIALLLGAVGQYLFVENEPGISIPLFVLGCYSLFFYSVQGRLGGFDKWKGQSKTGWLLFGPIAAIALTYGLFANELFRVLNLGALMIMMVAQTMLLTRGGSQPWHRPGFLGELLAQWLITPLTHLTVPFGILAGWFGFEKGSFRSRGGKLGKVALGLLVAAPLMLIVVALLASADGIFESWIERIPNLIDDETIGEGIGRIVFGAGIAFYVFCYVWGLLFRKPKTDDALEAAFPKEPHGVPGEKRQSIAYIDPTIAATVLVCVNIVYVLFVAIQFSYLFGAAEGMLPEGTAYAEYARRGFAELVAIAIINMGLLLLGLHFVKLEGKLLERLKQTLLTVLMGCSVIMLISAYSRLSLYEETYGFTELRLLVHGFMVLLAVMMLAAIVRIWYGRYSLAKVNIALAIVAYVIMNYANLDARIAENNADRYERTGRIDWAYLSTLSVDAAPALMKLQERHPQLAEVRDILKQMRMEAAGRKEWQSWNAAFERLKPE
ncbi:DUF4173 domain-containing protein [Paenibacillus sp. LHD-117]|uniref:DUF4153 domain-containing protein n=1 Tax=Paenibacillus sp. LHD-117 TaxID=3071412 RepID=UPI0027E04A56|nr:DUF4173 domain-containing protein [Paenibacillus sp. LHD-117]MDQ6419705.1 DUF4173 domain-containing protein [Paenibacillus sp. LHD-117]